MCRVGDHTLDRQVSVELGTDNSLEFALVRPKGRKFDVIADLV